VVPVVGVVSRPGEMLALRAESLQLWEMEVKDLRHVLTWWQRCKSDDRPWLKRHLKAVKSGKGDLLIHELGGSRSFGELTVASESQNPDLLRAFRRGNVTDAGWEALFTMLNERLLQVPLHVQMKRRRGNRGVEGQSQSDQVLRPLNLLSAMWLQAEQAIAGNTEFRACQECSRFFAMTSERRGDARFCTDACKSRAYRHRKARAVSLSQQGMAIENIAEKLGSDPAKVGEWIRKSERRENK
jgi:hypothetical protein